MCFLIPNVKYCLILFNLLTALSSKFMLICLNKFAVLSYFLCFKVNTKRKAQAEADAKVHAQKTKMRQIKHILSHPSDTDSLNSVPTTPRSRAYTTTAHITPAASEPDLSKAEATGSNYSLRGAHKRAMTAYTNSVKQQATVTAKPRTKSPPPTKPVRSILDHPW